MQTASAAVWGSRPWQPTPTHPWYVSVNWSVLLASLNTLVEHTAHMDILLLTFPDKLLTVRSSISRLTKATITAEVASIETGTCCNSTSRAGASQLSTTAHTVVVHIKHRTACSSCSGGVLQLTQILSVVHFTKRSTVTLCTVAAPIVAAIETSILTETHIYPWALF